MTARSWTGSRRRWGMVIALGMALGAGSSAWWWLRPSADRLAAARRAYRSGDWDRAAEAARRQLRGDGDDLEALRIYARSSIRRNRDEVGNAIYKDRIGPERMQSEDYYLVGLSLARLGRDETALQVWEKGAGAEPTHPELLESLARMAMTLGRWDAADSAARRLARQTGWERRGWLLLGEVRDHLDDPIAAAEALDRGLRIDLTEGEDPREQARHRRLLARCWLQLGRPAAAREQLEQTPNDVGGDADREARWLLSRAFLQQGRIEEALDALKQSGSFRDEHPLIPDPGPYVGSARCAECHRDISRTYRLTRHSRTFYHGTGIAELPMPEGPLTDPDEPGVTLTLHRKGSRVRAETRNGDEVLQSVVDYAFGTTDRYVTMIGRDDAGMYRALRLSYYRTSEGSNWGRTSGDAGSPDVHERIRGRTIAVTDGVVRCLVCHVTRPRDFRDPPPADAGPEADDPAIGCERCHGPGGNHLAAIAADWSDPAIAVARAGKAPAATVNAQCAACHTVDFKSAIQAAPDDPRFVRSPGYTLTFSRCYMESDDRLTCLTCHDPHREPESSTAVHEANCRSCHDPGRTSKSRGRVCPVNPAKGCLECHMPKMPVADLHTKLTDHFIRVRARTGTGPAP